MAESKMPAKIWAGDPSTKGCVVSFITPSRDYSAPYIRADLVEPLVEALQGMVRRYVELVASGDAGFWDAEKEGEVIASRAALSSWEAGQ